MFPAFGGQSVPEPVRHHWRRSHRGNRVSRLSKEYCGKKMTSLQYFCIYYTAHNLLYIYYTIQPDLARGLPFPDPFSMILPPIVQTDRCLCKAWHIYIIVIINSKPQTAAVSAMCLHLCNDPGWARRRADNSSVLIVWRTDSIVHNHGQFGLYLTCAEGRESPIWQVLRRTYPHNMSTLVGILFCTTPQKHMLQIDILCIIDLRSKSTTNWCCCCCRRCRGEEL